MNLADLPLAPVSKQAKEDWDRRLRDECIRDGRASRRLGIKVSACPPFRDPDMAINWRNGWRWEDEELSAKKRR